MFYVRSCSVSINNCKSDSVSCRYKQHHIRTNSQNNCIVGQAPVPNIYRNKWQSCIHSQRERSPLIVSVVTVNICILSSHLKAKIEPYFVHINVNFIITFILKNMTLVYFILAEFKYGSD